MRFVAFAGVGVAAFLPAGCAVAVVWLLARLIGTLAR
jgi:hypothetical protein